MTAAVALLLLACSRKESTPARSGDCGDCHVQETAEWNSSLHHSSFTDRDFQASFAVEPEKFCFDCHAPLASARGDTAGEARGVGCRSCHVTENGHGAPKTDCANCHEFAFPRRAETMQSTIREHADSELHAVACTSCHMTKLADGHRDHRFDVSRNTEFMKRALVVSATRTSDGIAIELTPRNVGHKLPTGDLFRRLLVVVRAESAEGAPLGDEEVVLGRRFEHTQSLAHEIADTRLSGPRTIELKGEWLTGAARITVEVRYERVAQTTEIRDARGGWQRRDSVFAKMVLAERVFER